MFRRIQRIHFVGIGGIGMCGIAELLAGQGYRVTGTDLREGPTVSRLRMLGVDVRIGHAGEHVGDADVVVYSSAVRPGNPELLEAERRKIPVIPRAEMLAELMRLKDGVAVGGSHGKTTTTSLVAHVLHAAGLDPTAVIGGRVMAPADPPGKYAALHVKAGDRAAATEVVRSGARLGGGPLLVAEADESDGSFLRLAPIIAVVTNIDPEHMDHYGSVEALHDAFVSFANRVPFWGLSVLCIDHPGVQAILPRMTRRTTTYGFSPQADLVASDVVMDGGVTRFGVRRRGEPLGAVGLPLAGDHNVQNALATLAVALELDVPFAAAAGALASFPGIERRFERKGAARGVEVVDDYGHHPAEIRATLAAARQLHPGRVVVVFQPHRYTRTQHLFEEFATAFHQADVVLLTEIYAAGEDKIPGVDSARLSDAIRAHGQRDVRFVAELDAVAGALVPELAAGDLVITLGAGNVSSLGPKLLAALEAAT
ncbi:MAG: UDP-N-acetylmuramate--L-alanine ligase [Proteobacteria bacterium]|nr:MAG: UDP-N-acetylmuramate--L-alanine ligase [Pseudomonadota bacterium]